MASLKDRAKKAKTIFSLDPPTPTFFSPSWPDITPQTSSDILTTSLSLLTDLQTLQESSTTTSTSEDGRPKILAGPNPVTAYLEHLVQLAVPIPLSKPSSKTTEDKPPKEIRRPLAVLVTRSDQPSVLHSHIPFLCATASVPLIALPKGSEQKLVKILKPKNGSVYMLVVFEDTPGMKDLRKLLLDEEGHIVVGKVGMPEVLQTSEAKWLDTRTKIVQTFVGERRKGKRKIGEDVDTPAKGVGGGDKAPTKKPRKEIG